MSKQAKGKGKAATVRIADFENVEDFVQPGKVAAVKKQQVQAVPTEAAADDEDELAEGSSQTADDDDDEDLESDEDEEYEVDEKAMNRLLELLGDVDASELGLDFDEEEEEEESDEEEEDDDEEDVSGAEHEDEEISGSDESDEDDDDEELDEDEQPSRQSMKQQELAAKKQQDIVLERILDRFKINVPFFENQTLTCPEPLEITDVSDDLSRELQFYKLSLWAAQQASKLFKAAGLPYERPNDYYAEMLKSDEHMERIRQKLLDDSANIKASEQAKKQRHLKKFGKQVQVEKQKEREKSKREMNDKVKSFRKKRKAGDDGAEPAEFDIGVLDKDDSRPTKKARGGANVRGKTRSQRETKFGHSTSSRRPKENDRESTNAAFGGRGGGRGGRGGRGGSRGGGMSRGGGASKQRRPGKSKRQ